MALRASDEGPRGDPCERLPLLSVSHYRSVGCAQTPSGRTSHFVSRISKNSRATSCTLVAHSAAFSSDVMQDLTKGSVSSHLIKTGSFMLVTMVFQTLYFLVDLYWVGRLGKEAVAAVGVAGNLQFIVLAISQMLGVGVTTLVSHAVGRKDRD